MIGQLPKTLEVAGKQYDIRSDYRVALLIFEAFDDPDLSELEKTTVCLQCLYPTVPDNVKEAYAQAVWFLDGGDTVKKQQFKRKVIDWKQDESLIFPAINKSAGFETRSADYMHWWTFLGYFNCISEGLYTQVLSIRAKKAKGKKLEKYEQETYREFKDMIDIKPRYSAAEIEEMERLKALL